MKLTKSAMQWVVVPLALVAASAAAARASWPSGDPSTWISSGSPVSAAKLLGLFNDADARLNALEGTRFLYATINPSCGIVASSGPAGALTLSTGSSLSSGCSFNIASGVFSVSPVCSFSAVSSNTCVGFGAIAPTVTSLHIATTACNSGTSYIDNNVNVICVGPK